MEGITSKLKLFTNKWSKFLLDTIHLSEEKQKDLTYLGLLFLIICIFFWKVILYPQNMIFSNNSDIVTQFYPWRTVADEAISNGQLPFWNPYTFGGEPLLSNPQLGFFYPINLIMFSIFPANLVFGYGFILHLFIASSSIYLVARRFELTRISSLLVGLTFIFSGYFMGHLYAAHYPQVCAASWVPLIFLLFDKTLTKRSWRMGLLVGFFVGVQFLAGYIMMTLMTAMLLIFYFIYYIIISWKKMDLVERTKLGLISISAGVLSLIVSSVQLAATYQYSNLTTRAGGVGYAYATSYSLPPSHLIMLILPYFFGGPMDKSYWGTWSYWDLSMYMGIFTIVLIPFAFHYRKNTYVKFFTVFGLFSWIMALGAHTPVYWIFWKFVPGFDLLRGPSRFVVLFIFSSSLLAGFGFNYLQQVLSSIQRKRLERFTRAFTLGAFIVVVGTLSLHLLIGNLEDMTLNLASRIYPDARDLSVELSLILKELAIFSVIVSFSALLLILRVRRREHRKIFRWAVVLFILLNLGYYHHGFVDSRHPRDIYAVDDYVQFLIDNSDGYRVYDSTPPDIELIKDNFQIMYGIHTVKGYNPLHLKYYEDVFDSLRNLSNNHNHPILDLLCVKYVLSAERLNDSGFVLVFEDTEMGVYIYENINVLPKAFLMENVTSIPDKEIIKRMRDPDFDPRKMVLLNDFPGELSVGSFKNGLIENGSVRIVDESINEIELISNCTRPSFLVLSQSYYPTWKVFVDDAEKTIHRAYYAFNGVYVEAGEHQIRFVNNRMFY